MFITNQKYLEEYAKDYQLAEKVLGYTLRQEEKQMLDLKVEAFAEKPQQIAYAAPDEIIGRECIQAFVMNMSAATSLAELEQIEGITLPEDLIEGTYNEWTTPKWAKAGDVVFFMHAKTAKAKITKLRTELDKNRNHMAQDKYDRLMSFILHALEIYQKYGGKIFAVGRVCGGPEYLQPDDLMGDVFHWRSRNYSRIDNILELDNPLDISTFSQYITLAKGSAITPLVDLEFDRLREEIGRRNELSPFITDAVAGVMPLRSINKRNWIEGSNPYRRSFIYEKQFRRYYVDYLLQEIGDRKKYFTECCCHRNDIHTSFMDYVICFDGKYLPVEVKLSVKSEENIIRQVSKYVYNSDVLLTKNAERPVSGAAFHNGKVLIIDTEKLYMYDASLNDYKEIFDLNQLRSKDNLHEVKRAIRASLNA